MAGTNYKTVTRVATEADCQKLCENDGDTCKSVYYYVAAKYCYMKTFGRFDGKLTAHAAYNYYEKKCESEFRVQFAAWQSFNLGTSWFPDDCTWQGPYKNRYLSGYNTKTLNTVTENECKTACEEETDFHCLSFEYLISYRRCYLTYVNRGSGITLTQSVQYSYYERNCEGNIPSVYSLIRLDEVSVLKYYYDNPKPLPFVTLPHPPINSSLSLKPCVYFVFRAIQELRWE